MASFANFFRKTIAGNVNQDDFATSGRRQRVPFIFTSDLMLSQAGTSPVGGRGLGADEGDGSILQPITITGTGSTAVITPTDVMGGEAPTPASQALVKMAINPNSIKWSQSKRYTKTDVMDGSIFTHFLDSNQQNNDLLRLEFSGNTGYIGPNAPGSREKLLAWHRLYNISRQPMVYFDGQQWLPNRFYIKYNSPRFATQSITFTGVYEGVVQFEDNANEPLSGPYSFAFIVTKSNPSLDKIMSILEATI